MSDRKSQLRPAATVRRRWAVAGAAAVFGVGAVAVQARAAEPTTAELMEQVKALQAKVEQLETKQGRQDQRQQQAVDTAAVDRAVDAVLKDAEGRSQLLAVEGFTAGYDNGKFLIRSADGNFVLNPNVQFQFRYVADFRNDAKNGGSSNNDDTGFEVRRLKFAVDGNVFGKDLTYKFQWATSRSTGNLQLDEGWVRYQIPGTPFAVKAGSMLNDFDHETGVSSKRQLAVERSVLHEIIAGGGTGSENYVQGVQAIYDDGGPLRATLLYHDGFNSRNTNFQEGGGGAPLLGLNNIQWAVAARVDYKIKGEWKQYDDFTALGNKTDLLVVGAGGDLDESQNEKAYFHTVDVQWEPQAVPGLSMYAAYVGLLRDVRHVGAGVDDKPYDFGFLAQAAYLLDDQWEVFARYDYTELDNNGPATAGSLGAAALVTDHVHEITVGLNYYLHSHAAKFTLDASWLPNGSPTDLNGAGVLAQPTDKDQFVVRGQFQLLL